MKENLCGIYSITNTTNGKKYIGMSRNIHRRWAEHTSELNGHAHDNVFLQRAWDKDGQDAFDFAVVELCAESVLSEREIFYIKEYHSLSHEHGYNLTTGGENTSIGKLVIRLSDGKIFSTVKAAANDAQITSVTMILWCRSKHKYAYLDEFNAMSNEEQDYWLTFDWDKHDHEKLSKAHSKENLSAKSRQAYSRCTTGGRNPRAYKVYSPQLDMTFDCCRDAAKYCGTTGANIASCIKGLIKTSGKNPKTNERLTWIKV